MEILFLAVLIGLLPASVAHSKGRNFVLWWLYGAAVFVIALPHSLIMRSTASGLDRQRAADGLRPCAHCAEYIRPNAQVCRYCSRDVVPT